MGGGTGRCSPYLGMGQMHTNFPDTHRRAYLTAIVVLTLCVCACVFSSLTSRLPLLNWHSPALALFDLPGQQKEIKS